MNRQTLRPETARFLEELAQYAKKELQHPTPLGMLIDHAREGDRWPVIEELSFYAKFMTKAQDLMNRIGRDGEGYDKISEEFGKSTTTVQSRLKELLSGMPEERRINLEETFLNLDQKSFAQLMGLLNDLTWVKNWMVDGREIP